MIAKPCRPGGRTLSPQATYAMRAAAVESLRLAGYTCPEPVVTPHAAQMDVALTAAQPVLGFVRQVALRLAPALRRRTRPTNFGITIAVERDDGCPALAAWATAANRS